MLNKAVIPTRVLLKVEFHKVPLLLRPHPKERKSHSEILFFWWLFSTLVPVNPQVQRWYHSLRLGFVLFFKYRCWNGAMEDVSRPDFLCLMKWSHFLCCYFVPLLTLLPYSRATCEWVFCLFPAWPIPEPPPPIWQRKLRWDMWGSICNLVFLAFWLGRAAGGGWSKY